LLFGLRGLGSNVNVQGICVRRAVAIQHKRIIARCDEIADLLGVSNPVSADDIQLDESFLAPGYGQLNPMTIEAIKLAAGREALLTDPVYTGKVMAAVLRHAGERSKSTNLLMIHTGGIPALFAYANDLIAAAK
jgi:D-cysteine desulfhydrase/L-cysteate sulfo-lyase